jgi:hypothetical protein
VETSFFNVPGNLDIRGWYPAAAYRISKRLQLGTYYSRFVMDWNAIPALNVPPDGDQSLPNRHIYDKVVTARFDLTNQWNVKVEGHFMDGYGMDLYPSGFYAPDNPGGLKPKTNLLIVRTGWYF